MRTVSVVCIVAGVVSLALAVIARVIIPGRLIPIFGGVQAATLIVLSSVLFLLAVAINTLPPEKPKT